MLIQHDKDKVLEKRIYELFGETGHNPHLNAQGMFDDMPNKKEVTEKDFWGWRSSYSFKAEAWVGSVKTADVDPDNIHGNPRWGTMIVFLVDHSNMAGGGFAVVYEYAYKNEKVRYFEWAQCNHAEHGWTSRNTGRCLNEYTCKGCGYSYEVDSSD